MSDSSNLQLSSKERPNADHDLAFHYWGTINYFVNLIKASEFKAGLILSFYGIILNFIYQNIEHAAEQLDHSLILYIMMGLWLASILTSELAFYK